MQVKQLLIVAFAFLTLTGLHLFLGEIGLVPDVPSGVVVTKSDQSPETLAAIAKEIDEIENDPIYDPAPRTTSTPYNQLLPNERYFIYSPTGGLSNQLIEFPSPWRFVP